MSEFAYVYILASKYKRLYIGVTTTFTERIREHKTKFYPRSFTAKYSIDRLVYFERFVSITAAIAREKQLKGWLRLRKVALIVASNPTWRDLSADWGKPVEPFSETNLRKPRSFGDEDAIAEAQERFGAFEDDVPF